MRIKTHPDRLKRNSALSPEESAEIDDAAAKVGWAADVLCDPEMVSCRDCRLISFELKRLADGFGSGRSMIGRYAVGLEGARVGDTAVVMLRGGGGGERVEGEEEVVWTL